MDYSSEEDFDRYMEDISERRNSIATKKIIRDFQNPFEYYNLEEFRKRYRFPKEIVLNIIFPLLSEDLAKRTKRGLPIPPIHQLLVALRFYASGSFQILSGDLIKISQATVSRIVKRVSHLIALKIQLFIKYPINTQEIKQKFYETAHFPGVVGAVDGTHIPIQNPGGASAEMFRNRKKFFSINVQIICGPDLKIYDIVADRPGSVHDNRIFVESLIKLKMEQGTMDGVLLGDSGYGCKKYLLTPVPHPQSISEQNYNKAHIKTRNTVERTIGVWKRVFPCLSKKMALNLTTSCHVIVATAVLYNICISYDAIEDMEQNIQIRPSTSGRTISTNREGLLFRRMFIQRHF